MSRQRTLDEIITDFLLNTCRVRPPISKYALQTAVYCVHETTDGDKKGDWVIPVITGSVAEFYVEPMYSHVGDVDLMFHRSYHLAIPRGHPPPTQLPAEFSDYVQVFEIMDSDFPGYVYLPLRYLLIYCTDDDKYNYFEYDSGHCLAKWLCIEGDTRTHHGPAIVTYYSHISLNTDSVHCVRCLTWPPQACTRTYTQVIYDTVLPRLCCHHLSLLRSSTLDKNESFPP